MAVTLNRIERGSIRRDSGGWVVEEHAFVDGITGNARAKAYIAATAPGLPPYGSAHPSVPGVFLTDVEARPEVGSNSQWDVTLIYRSPSADDEVAPGGSSDRGPLSVSLDASTTTEKALTDINGNLMAVGYFGSVSTVTWDYTAKQVSIVTTSDISAYQVNTPDVQRPRLVATLSRWERNNPIGVATTLVGRVNSAQWHGYPPKTWLCTAVRTNPRTDGRHDVDYILQYRPETWRFDGSIRINNIVPPEARPGNGIGTFDVYRGYNFNALGLRL